MKRLELIKTRKDKKLTQDEIARTIGINRSYYGLIENGKRNPSLKIALKISSFLEAPLNELFENEIFFIEKCYSLQINQYLEVLQNGHGSNKNQLQQAGNI